MKGDFIGFSFNGVSNEELGFIRVSDGDRFNDTTTPEIEDKTVEMPGVDGVYFYGSNFKDRKFSIKIAFDEMTEEQLRKFKKTFGVKEHGLLIFEEAPYKAYMVKVGSAPELDYVCFDERKTVLSNFDGIYGATTINRKTGETERIYKGEGTLEFVAYYPFAKSVYKTLNEYTNSNKSEWAAASGLKTSLSGYDTYSGSSSVTVYNPGDIETGFKVYVPFSGSSAYFDVSDGTAALNVGTSGNQVQKRGSDAGFIVNTTNGLVEGVDSSRNTTGNIYNDYVTGEFFKLPPSDNSYTLTVQTSASSLTFDYDYLYF